MSIISSQMSEYADKGSWIRKMFEQGTQMKAEFGAENVFDFSLGNPDLPPPSGVRNALVSMAERMDQPFSVGYMANAGYPDVREAVAEKASAEQGVKVSGEDLIMTCGAAGGLNSFIRTVINPGEEMLGVAPYFVEYGFYTENYGASFRSVMSNPDDFSLDLEAIEREIGEKTRAFLINSPHNPTGAVYSEDEIKALSDILRKKSAEYGKPIFLAADEPYRFLAYDGATVPSILKHYEHGVVVSSFSKNMSLPGERVGYVLVNPEMKEKREVLGGLTLANRILGYVNAPAIGQKLLLNTLNDQVDITVYDHRRKAMAKVLDNAGYEYSMPKGAFYFFPKAPGGDDLAFVELLRQQKVLAVPGRGFGGPGYFRLAFCVNETVINNAAQGFKKAIENL